MNRIINIRLIKFGIVGLSGMFIDFTITWLCRDIWNLNQYIANAAGFSFAVAGNFYLNRIWTFEQKTVNIGFQFFRFILVSFSGLALNSFLLYLLISNSNLNFYFSKFIVIGLVFFWNYCLNSLFTFK